MDRNELLIGIGGLILTGLGYFAGVVRTERQHNREDSEGRITRVLDTYMAAANAAKINGYPGLIRAGVGTLKDDQEIRELIDRIVKHGHGWDPRKALGHVDAHRFFQLAIERRVDFYQSGAVEKLVAEIGTKGG